MIHKESSTPVARRCPKSVKKTSRNKHSKYFRPEPQHPVPDVPSSWQAVTITGHVIETGRMVEGWFGQCVAETQTIYTIEVDGTLLAQGVDYDTAYAFIQTVTQGYRADEKRTPLSILKNACSPGVVGEGYNTVTIEKASEAFKRNVGGHLSFGYYNAEVAA